MISKGVLFITVELGIINNFVGHVRQIKGHTLMSNQVSDIRLRSTHFQNK